MVGVGVTGEKKRDRKEGEEGVGGAGVYEWLAVGVTCAVAG